MTMKGDPLLSSDAKRRLGAEVSEPVAGAECAKCERTIALVEQLSEGDRELVAFLMRERDGILDRHDEIQRLRHAIQDHRMSIRAAGMVRVDSRDVPIADEKQRADERLWATLDA